MAETIDTNLLRLFDGKYFDEDPSIQDLCDLSFPEENKSVPILPDTVKYIAMFILINEPKQVLMVQEAKYSCRGLWYLPSGCMEKGESIQEACTREVLKDTGLNVDISTLLAVNCSNGFYFRFILTGTIIGGELKTRPDKYSLQAKWIGDLSKVKLRSNDILWVIDFGREFDRQQHSKYLPKRKIILPIEKAHTKSYLRIVLVIKRCQTNTMHVLLSQKNGKPAHLPVVEIERNRPLDSTITKCLDEFLVGHVVHMSPRGILAVEHNASGFVTDGIVTDGICLTELFQILRPMEDMSFVVKNAVWHELGQSASAELMAVLAAPNRTLGITTVHY